MTRLEKEDAPVLKVRHGSKSFALILLCACSNGLILGIPLNAFSLMTLCISFLQMNRSCYFAFFYKIHHLIEQ